MRVRRPPWSVLCSALLVATLPFLPPSGAARASAAGPVAARASGASFVRTVAPIAASTAASTARTDPCPSGLVALTFDDGPRSPLTPRLLSVLHDRHVPATFFVLGERARAEPETLRRTAALGFTIGNHSFAHESLLRLDSGGVESTLRRTRRAIRAAGVRPSNLMRPPYGDIDPRVRGVVRDLGLVPVLWTADPRDWDGRSAASIVRGTLAQLRPGEPNIVLLHDGVTSSARTLAALPRIVRGVRARGYCLAALDRRGRPRPPVPRVVVADSSVRERPGGSVLRFVIGLSRATSRTTSVRVRTVARTAATGGDFRALDRRVLIAVGARRAVVQVRVRDDLRDERAERLTLRLSAAHGLRIRDGTAMGTILDDDPPPGLRIRDVEVEEPGSGDLEVPLVVRLTRASERRVRVTVSTEPGTADSGDFVPATERLTFEPGEVEARFTVRVLADEVDEDVETFTVRVGEGTNVDLSDAAATVTVVPPSPASTETVMPRSGPADGSSPSVSAGAVPMPPG